MHKAMMPTFDVISVSRAVLESGPKMSKKYPLPMPTLNEVQQQRLSESAGAAQLLHRRQQATSS